MISETSLGQSLPLEPETRDLIIKKLKMRKMKVDIQKENLDSYLVKSMEASIWKISGEDFLLTDQKLQQVFRMMIRSPEKVQRLEMSFLKNEWRKEVRLKYIIGSIKRMSSLKRLDIDFQEFGGIADASLKNLAAGLKRLSSLHTLSLGIRRRDKITDVGLKSLIQGLKRLNSLRTLSLTFEGNE